MRQREHHTEKREAGNPQTEIRRQPQRGGGKREQPVHRQLEGFFEGVLRHAGGALGAVKFHRGLPEAAPRPQPAQVTAAFGQRVHHRDNALVEQAEIAGVAGHRQRRQFLQQPVKAPGEKFFEQRVAPLFARGKNDFVAFAPFGEQPGNFLRRILQVGINHHHRVAGGEVQTGADGGLVAEISRKRKATPARVVLVLRLKDFPGAVARAIVHTENFVVGLPRCRHRAQPLKQARQHGFLVEARNDDGDFWHGYDALVK